MIQIRDATTDDLEILLDLGSKMLAESMEPYPAIDHEQARKYLDMAVSMPGFFLMAIAEDEISIGMITAVAGPHCFSPVLRSASDLLFVLPEYRGGRAAIKLVQRFKDWADGIGTASDTMSVATGISPERTGRFFKFMGFRPMEMIYRRDNVYRN